MAVISKKKTVATTDEKVVAKKTTAAPTKKATTTEKKVETKKTVSTVPTEKKTEGKKKISLTGGNKTQKNYEIKEGSQATQDAFIDRYYKKLVELGYDVNKEMVKKLKKSYSETLKEVTDIASYHDVDAGIYYARRYIESRVTAPPLAKGGLKTLMKGHYELKVRKLIGDSDEYKFFGQLSEDGSTFITVDGEEISLNNEEEIVKPVNTKKVVAKKKPVVEEEEIEEEELVEEDEDDAEVEEETEEDFDNTDDEFDDFLDDEE